MIIKIVKLFVNKIKSFQLEYTFWNSETYMHADYYIHQFYLKYIHVLLPHKIYATAIKKNLTHV